MLNAYSETKLIKGKLFCFGLGFTGEALAQDLIQNGWQVAGTSRTAEGAARLQELGIEGFVFNRESPVDLFRDILPGCTHLLSSVPPDEAGDPVLDHHYSDLVTFGQHLKWTGYLSTTGVYGTRDGGWVDETSERRPGSERSQRRKDAEDQWLSLGQEVGFPVQLFRLAGIYGPGRSVFDQIKAGRAKRVDRPGQVFSRIHVDDIVSVLKASMAQPRGGAAYNVCDNEPASPADVTGTACEMLGVPIPPLVPFEDAGLSSMAQSFWADNKRVRNSLIAEELGVILKYPDYKAGLKALFDAETQL